MTEREFKGITGREINGEIKRIILSCDCDCKNCVLFNTVKGFHEDIEVTICSKLTLLLDNIK